MSWEFLWPWCTGHRDSSPWTHSFCWVPEFRSVHQQYTKTEHIMGNANQRIVLTEVRSCTELPFCHVKQHSTSISLLGWRDLHELCNFYKSQCNSSSSSTWVAHHICSTHTLEISEKIQATLPFQLKPAQSKTNVVISGSSELRLQQWDLEWDQPTTNDAFVDRSSRPIHLLPQEGLFWSNWGTLTTPIPRAWELKLLLPDSTFVSVWVQADVPEPLWQHAKAQK